MYVLDVRIEKLQTEIETLERIINFIPYLFVDIIVDAFECFDFCLEFFNSYVKYVHYNSNLRFSIISFGPHINIDSVSNPLGKTNHAE